MNTERDKFLTEAMGECFEVYGRNKNGEPRRCNYCDNPLATDFSTWEGFGKLWTWAQKQGWWIKIMLRFQNEGFYHYIHPDRFADAVYAFLKERA